MNNIFSLKEIDDFSEKINLDDLYEKKRMKNQMELDIFNRLLSRIHNKIKITSKQFIEQQYIFFVVPEIMIGLPKYNHSNCVSYLMYKLGDNGFNVKYITPNVLFISWKHWIPKYVTQEIKKKTGTSYDNYGNIINKKDEEKDNKSHDTLLLNKDKHKEKDKKNKDNDYRSINTYQPTGKLIYNTELLEKMQNKIQ